MLSTPGHTLQAASPDSVYREFSLYELETFSSYYQREIDMLQHEKEMLIRQGIADGERLLATSPDTGVMADILIRLAELYYYREKDDYLKKMEAFHTELGKGVAGTDSALQTEPRPAFTRALTLYDQIITMFPNSEMVDDALYNKGFLYEEMGDYEVAVSTYYKLIKSFPSSSYVPEAYMRLGEYFFNPPRNDLGKAIVSYEMVVNHPSHVRYYEALYKLGWSHYRLSQYPEAISYFTTLVEDHQIGLYLSRPEEAETMHFRDEAIEYIAISFLDFGGPQKAGAYVRQIGNPAWGLSMLEKLGDIYMKDKEDYRNAIVTYRILRELSRNSDEAPLIQKKIVDCYVALNEFRNAFEERLTLFLEYHPGSTWWGQRRSEKSKLRTYRLAEEALRRNVNWLLKEAAEKQSTPLYEMTVDAGRRYLKAFPEDLQAYQVRWNLAFILDTRLNRYQEALQEYLTLSMVYQDEAYETFARERGLNTIQDAAENAIVVADILYQEELKQNPAVQHTERDFFDDMVLEPVSLSAAAGWLALAYDNFIKLFPFDAKTPTMLANAGALFSAHNQFDASLKYFKTLVLYFPESEQAKTIQYAILENYFGKRDYDSVELLAKRILRADYPAEIRNKTERRLGEAIFLRAQHWSGRGEPEKAAEEFLRLTLEVPKIAFADRALFNAAREFEEIRQYPRAIRAYEQLRASYPASSLFLTATNNLAIDYVEIGEYGRASDRYLELSNFSKDSVQIHDGLYNAYFFADKAGDWNRAIVCAERYTSRYAQRPEAAGISFRLAAYADSLGQDARKRAYRRRFLEQYSGTGLAVETACRLGKEYLAADSLAQAEEAFNRAHDLNQALHRNHGEGNDFYAAEALMSVCRLLRERLEAIRIADSGTARSSTVDRLVTLRDGLIRRYRETVAYQTIHAPEALFRIGETQERFAAIWAGQSVVEADPAKKAVLEKTLLEETTRVLSDAFLSYSNALRILRQFQEKQNNVDNPDSAGHDSTAIVTEGWMTRSGEKISEMLYRIAETSAKAIDNLLAVPVPADLRAEARLEYRSQVLLKAIRPLLDTVVGAHLRNLSISDSLGLDNPWMEASRQKVLTSLTILGQAYSDLSREALALFEAFRLSYLNEMKTSRPEEASDTPAAMATLIESARTYAAAGLEFYASGLRRLKAEKFIPRIQTQFRDTVHAFIVDTDGLLSSLNQQALDDQSRADSLFRATQDILYENMLAAFEDNVFFIGENRKALLESAFRFYTDEQDSRAVAFGLDLLSLDPELYAGRLEIPLDTLVVPMDSTWLVASQPLTGLEQAIPDSNRWILFSSWRSPQSGTETGPLRYIGKGFDIQGYPVGGRIETGSFSVQGCYLNGRRILLNKTDGTIQIKDGLRANSNWLALQVSEAESVSLNGEIWIQYVAGEGK